MKSSVYKLLPGHERYRECKECKKPFMATHLSQEYCPNSKCKQEFNNRSSRDTNKQIKQVLTLTELEKRHRHQALEKTINLFQNLGIDENGRYYEFENVVSAGAELWAYSERIRNACQEVSYSYYYGPYLVSRRDETKILIVKTRENEKFN